MAKTASRQRLLSISMFDELKHDLQLYFRLIGLEIRGQLQYRASFLMDMISTGIILAMFFVSLYLVLERFGTIGGWRLGEIAFLYGMVEMSFGLMDMIFSGFDPGHFGLRIRKGTFDQMLLRPLPLTLQVFGSQFVMRRLGRILQGATVLIYGFTQLDITWTWGKTIYLPIVVISQVAFFGGLFIIGATITFWTVESIEFINIFTYGGTEMISYPMHIYPRWMRDFFTFIIPAMLINYLPALYFLDRQAPFTVPAIGPFLAPLAGVIMLVVALAFWRFGVRHYQSTGS